MKKIKAPRRIVQPSLAAGQLWRMAGADLRVGMVGKLLVHYKFRHDQSFKFDDNPTPPNSRH